MSSIDIYIADRAERERCRLELGDDHLIQFLEHAPLLGVVAVIAMREADCDSYRAVLRRLVELAVPPPDRAILDVAAERFPTELLPVMKRAVELASTNPSVARLAAALGLPRRTLAERLHRAGLPPAGVLIGWVRALLAAHRLQGTAGPVRSVATSLAFASERALRRHLHAHGAAGPSALRRAPLAFEALLADFDRALAGGVSFSPAARYPRPGPRTRRATAALPGD